MITQQPSWLADLVAQLGHLEPEFFSRFLPPEEGGRPSAVLILFGPTADGGEDVVLTERSHSMRSHAGQVSFPGGSIDPTDSGPVSAEKQHTHLTLRSVAQRSVSKGGPRHGARCHPSRHSAALRSSG